ncbi:MAG: tetratricopeptide repeat protein [Acidobacteriaceae bacterium]|nr:tetratricopeptide repeat protein [Acidobacteriaceae bacterium]
MIADQQRAANISESEILAHVERITKSRIFAGSPRLCRFLTWTVQETMRSGGENIKQYVIGREVFDRREEFDPRADSIVRTEARRLRRKLREYYELEGRSDAVQISFKPGSYVAHFKTRDEGPKLQQKQAIAVLPFENLTASPDLEYFCRGMTESIQARLASSAGLKVISSLSAFRFEADSDPATIASELGVTLIVQGGIRQASDRIRVHAKAVETASGSYLWAGVFDRKMSDIFAVEDEIASSVAEAVVGRLSPHQRLRSIVVPSLEAYELYLQGRQHWSKLSPEGCQQALEYFTRAILLSPGYAAAYAAVADAYNWLIFFSTREPLDVIEPIKQSALRAIDLDPNCAEAYVALGSVAAVFESRWDEAERLFRQGLELRPSSVPAFIQRSFARLQTGDLEGARLDHEAATELDPLSPRCYRATGFRLYLERDYDAALAAFGRALKLGPEVKHTHYFRGLALLHAGRHNQAVEALLRSLNDSECGLYMGALVAAYAGSGRKRKAIQILRDLEELARNAFVSPIAFVHAYAGIGDLDRALDSLNRAAERRFLGLMQLKLEPLLDPLRNEGQFIAALEKLNLPRQAASAQGR